MRCRWRLGDERDCVKGWQQMTGLDAPTEKKGGALAFLGRSWDNRGMKISLVRQPRSQVRHHHHRRLAKITPFELPGSARVSGLDPLRTFPVWLSPLNNLPLPYAVRGMLLSLVWIVGAVYSYNEFMTRLIGVYPLGLDLWLVATLVAVFFLGRIVSWGLMVVLAIMIIRGVGTVGFMGTFWGPAQLFVLIAWLLAFAAVPERVMGAHIGKDA